MSYRLQNVGNSSSDIFRAGYLDYTAGGKDGVVAGILDELKLEQKKDRIIIGRGKLMVSGFPVLFEGREVVCVPLDGPNEKYMIVGVLTVSGQKAQSFYISLRKLNDLVQDDVNSTGEGVYEIMIAQFSIFYNRISSFKNTLTKIYAKPEQVGPTDFEIEVRQKCAKILTGKVDGDCAVRDSQEGYFENFQILGKSTYDGEKINSVPSSFTLKVHGKNYVDTRFSYDYAEDLEEVFQLGGMRDGFWTVNDDVIDVSGGQENTENVLSKENGFIRLNMRDLIQGRQYTVSAIASVYEAWVDANPECKVGISCKNGDNQLAFVEEVLPYPDEENYRPSGSKKIVMTFTAGEGKHEIDILIGGCSAYFEKLQFEQSPTCTDHEPYVGKSISIDLVDKNGNKYELNGIGQHCDRVEVQNGKVVLVKRLRKTSEYVDDVEGDTYYMTKNGLVQSEYGEVIPEDGEEVLYVSCNIENIELDLNRQLIDCIPTYCPNTVISMDTGILLPEIRANYGRSLDLVIKSIEERLNK